MLKSPMKVIYSFLSQILFSVILVFSSLLNLSVPCYTYFTCKFIITGLKQVKMNLSQDTTQCLETKVHEAH